MHMNATIKIFQCNNFKYFRFFSCGSRKFGKSKTKTSSNQWAQRQSKDPFVKQAERENYRCRSAYKLIQIDDKYRFLQPGKIVIDCGASPGSWSQVAVQRVNSLGTGTDSAKPRGKVIGIDLRYMAPLDGAHLMPFTDFTQDATQTKIRNLLNGLKADVILSDMAPNATGVKSFNHEFIVGLCFSVLHFSLHALKPGGNVLCKLWMGAEQERLETAMKCVFQHVRIVKPESSRTDSAEIFCLASGYKGITN